MVYHRNGLELGQKVHGKPTAELESVHGLEEFADTSVGRFS